MTHALKHGRKEFTEQLGPVRDSAIEDAVAKGCAPARSPHQGKRGPAGDRASEVGLGSFEPA